MDGNNCQKCWISKNIKKRYELAIEHKLKNKIRIGNEKKSKKDL